MQKNHVLKQAEQREKLFTSLYEKVFPLVARYIRRQGGNLEEAQDVFQDALIVYYEKTRSNNEVANENAYILGTSKILWIRKYREESLNVNLDDLHESQQATQPSISVISQQRITDFLASAGRKCMDLLRAFYYDKYSPGEIAAHFGYSGIRSVTVQKHKCMEKVRNTVKEKSFQYEDFIE